VQILGNICTRNCGFCSVPHGSPLPPDATEPGRIARLVQELDLRYLVITSVDRDDLPDGGASQFAECISAVRAARPATRFEILTPDFRGCQDMAMEILGRVRPFVFGHNVETVPRLYPKARPGGDYARSLQLLRNAHAAWPQTPLKSALMLGLGETAQEVAQVLADLRDCGVQRIAIGQYLRPDKDSLPVAEYIEPVRFEQLRRQAAQMGFRWVMASPFTRSSYFAEQDNAI
jgi:lipoic acid synthetase